jgi:hypothetical protein
MALTSTFVQNMTIGGQTFSATATATDETFLRSSVNASQLNTPLTGTVSVKTDANTGTLAVATHGIADSSKVDVYWALGNRRGMTTSAAETGTFVVDGGAGDDLPVATTAITVCIQKNLDLAFDGDEMAMLAVQTSTAGQATFYSGADAELLNCDLAAGNAYLWSSGTGITRPITGDPVSYIALTSQATAGTFEIGVHVNSL